ncbi:MAG TPA: hypothetical protein VNK91_05495 [Burkholderiaceae bacterium]|jgi:hypothetical protein|nr:hypothetical protein [Burkholderiaceae bacterium]
MATAQRRVWLAALFWALLLAFVVLDWVRSGARHNPFDEPPVVAIGSGGGAAAKGAHCAAAPAMK